MTAPRRTLDQLVRHADIAYAISTHRQGGRDAIRRACEEYAAGEVAALREALHEYVTGCPDCGGDGTIPFGMGWKFPVACQKCKTARAALAKHGGGK